MCGRAVNREGGKVRHEGKAFWRSGSASLLFLPPLETGKLSLASADGRTEEGVCSRSCAIATQHSFFNAFIISEIC